MKYSRTPHLPWSEGATSDDKMLKTTDMFVGKRVIASLKMDGENTGMTCNTIMLVHWIVKITPQDIGLRDFGVQLKWISLRI
jgi:hypothetical protein